MRPAPRPEDEKQRLEAVRATDILDTPPEGDFDALTRIAAAVCGTPIALVSLLDEHRQWFKSKVGLETSELPREQALCAHTILEPDLLVVPDARAVALGVDLRADPNLVDDEGRVSVPLHRATHPSAVRPGRQIRLGSSLGRWRGNVVAWDLALDPADPLVVVDDVEPC